MDPEQIDLRIELELRISLGEDRDALARILAFVRRAGGALKAHLSYRLGGQIIALVVTSRAIDIAVALEQAGVSVETETVLTVAAPHKTGMLSHLAATLAAEGIRVGYSYSACAGGRLFAVFRTDDNPRAEDVLRDFLVLAESTDHSGEDS